MFELLCYRDRTKVFTGSLYAADKVTPLVLQPGDTLLCKIGRGTDAVPILDMEAALPTANGSVINLTFAGAAAQGNTPAQPATFSLQLAQADLLLFDPGTWDIEISVEVAATGLLEVADTGALHVVAAMGGVLS